MVHAEASTFAQDVTKRQVYEQIMQQADALFDGQRNWVANTANAASLLWHGLHALPPPSSAVNWAGFYVIDAKQPSQLILGPFHGQVACQTIALGRGVCGQAAASGRTTLVEDVHIHPDHIACDSGTQSEIVVPIISECGDVLGVVDIDCTELRGFDEEDRVWLEKLAALLATACDW